MDKEYESIERIFQCKVCNTTHKVKLSKKLAEGRTKYPFPYVFLHDHIEGVEHKEVLTILYIDKTLQVRSAEIQELGYNSLFSKEQVIAIAEPLTEELSILREEIARLTKEIDRLKTANKKSKKK